IMTSTPCAILIVTASVDENAALVFAAMGYGALDAVNTPLLGVHGNEAGRAEFLAKLKTIEMLIRPRNARSELSKVARANALPASGYQLVAIGASSGGPSALLTILAMLPADFPLPVVVVQHVDMQFVPEMAAWLDLYTEVQVRIAKPNVRLAPGVVYLAARDEHLVLNAWGTLSYDAKPHDLPYRPSVDVFFNSVQRQGRGRCIAILLTGMGRDGAEGLLQLREDGHVTIAQDQATCAVYGMPRAAAELNAAVYVVPLLDIAPQLLRIVDAAALLEKTP
ncbi:MAG: chemotaxis response regulator protein-glutamate methylesterase, partial [Gammaproteobacteria bacterium]|nr:chemotaxis response regulator protein-glutamate methylesterase [Gammaproteobacteria bacterium]